ncbi:hypothetical protein GGS24DRAFT_497742 [Hypoxylon argillaceum]|nr:hypothetical protein GGS24DRAFT_497742 [Hypoxylon argillaceum]
MSQKPHQLRRVPKRVHFKSDSVLEEVRVIEYPESEQEHRHQPRGQKQKNQQECSLQNKAFLPQNRPKVPGKAPNLDSISPLFRCKSREELRDVLKAGNGAIADVFRGFNALHWYCNAKSTSPGIIRELLDQGIDINALDQRTRARGPVLRHTALGYACRNANVKAVHTLLQNGADPRGIVRSGTGSKAVPEKDSRGISIVYPSPLQELLCQPTHGPRPGRCPWIYHLSEQDEERDGYLDEDDADATPEFRALAGLADGGDDDDRPVCWACAADYHIWEPWPATEAERLSARERRRSCYRSQILRLGNRLHACVQLLLDYDCGSADPPAVAFPRCDDPRLWSGLDCLLETFWRFFYPLAVCEVMGSSSERPPPAYLSHPLSRPVFSVYGEICDMLLESAGYGAKGAMDGMRGQERLISLIAEHAELSSFKRGEYFDIDTQLEQLLCEQALSRRPST